MSRGGLRESPELMMPALRSRRKFALRAEELTFLPVSTNSGTTADAATPHSLCSIAVNN
jgi:hypothetical protein